MLHCAARPVSERRGANQRSPFRKLPFMARAAAAPPYKTRRRDAQPLPSPRPPANTGLSPSPLRRRCQSTQPPGKAPNRQGELTGVGPRPPPGRQRLSPRPRGQHLSLGSGARELPGRGRAAPGACSQGATVGGAGLCRNGQLAPLGHRLVGWVGGRGGAAGRVGAGDTTGHARAL